MTKKKFQSLKLFMTIEMNTKYKVILDFTKTDKHDNHFGCILATNKNRTKENEILTFSNMHRCIIQR